MWKRIAFANVDVLSSKFGFLMLALVLGVAAPVSSFTPPAAGDLGFDIYDTVVVQGVQGPLGYTAALILMVFGAYNVTQKNYSSGIGAVVGGTAMVAGDGIVTSLGMIV